MVIYYSQYCMQGTRSSLAIKIPDNELLKAHIGRWHEGIRGPDTRDREFGSRPYSHHVATLAYDSYHLRPDKQMLCRVESMEDAVTSIENAKNKLTACISPPGTGKTTVLADITIGAVMRGHTTLVCAVSNNALRAIYNASNFTLKSFFWVLV